MDRPDAARKGSLDTARGCLAARECRAAWDATLTALDERPFHPEAWVLLADIARTADDPDRARSCLAQASRLTPRWRTARQLVRDLDRQPTAETPPSASTSAWPTPTPAPAEPRLSVCLIVRNEERFLTQCLQSVRDVAWQIVVVDTGSTDRTIDLARAHGAEVSTFTWCDDFSAARNAALAAARGDWVLILDADEELRSDTLAALREDLRDACVMSYRLPLLNEGREHLGPSYVPRLFRNAPGVFFEGRIHESCFPSLNEQARAWSLESRTSRAVLVHHGYQSDVVADRRKQERNVALLQRAVRERPDDANLHMNLGMELCKANSAAEGLEHYRTAMRLLSRRPPQSILPEFREAFLSRYAGQLLAARDFNGVLDACASPLGRAAPLTATLHLLRANALLQLERFEPAAAEYEKCVATRKKPAHFPQAPEVFGTLPFQSWALALLRLQRPAAAQRVLESGLQEHPDDPALCGLLAKCLWQQNLPIPALETLHRIVSRDAAQRDAWLFGSRIALSRPDYLEFALDWTGEASRHHPADPDVAAQRAEALLLNGHTAQALVSWRNAAAEGNPRRLAALLLCEAVQEQLGMHTAQTGSVNAEFLRWYQQLAQAGARDALLRLHDQLPKLEPILPAAVSTLKAAMAEAQ